MSTLTPPTAIKFICGKGDLIAFIYEGPPIEAGNTLTKSAPDSHALIISVGVNAPGITIFEYLLHTLITPKLNLL